MYQTLNGMMMPIVPGRTSCFRYFLPDVPDPGSLPTCDTAGILNTTPAIIASIESTEAIKILLKENMTTNMESNLIFYDGLEQRCREDCCDAR